MKGSFMKRVAITILIATWLLLTRLAAHGYP